MSVAAKEARPLTGYHVLAMFVAFFGVIIAVNVGLAYQAITTFPGLEVANGYIASQSFDRDRKAQNALGWRLDHGYSAGQHELRLAFTDRDGSAIRVDGLQVLVGRTTETTEDVAPEFGLVGGAYLATANLHPGKWMMAVRAQAPDGTMFHQRIDLYVDK